jgi:hypothetical protein
MLNGEMKIFLTQKFGTYISGILYLGTFTSTLLPKQSLYTDKLQKKLQLNKKERMKFTCNPSTQR